MRDISDYSDMLSMRRPVLPGHPPMPRANRAAQFAAFSPLNGYEDSLAESARLVDERMEQDPEQIAAISEAISLLRERAADEPAVLMLCFFQDALKEGGEYRSVSGCVKKIDEAARRILLTDGQSIPFQDIYTITVQS